MGPEGAVRVDKPIGGFMGRLDSKIVYELRPDLEWDEERGERANDWIVGVADITNQRDMDGDGRNCAGMCSMGHWVRRVGITAVERVF